MRYLSLVFILSLLTTYSKGQSVASGYYLTQANDTVSAQIKIRKGVSGQAINDFSDEIEIVDSLKGFIKYHPEEINGFGFLYKGQHYRFISKPIKNGNKKFLSPIFTGPKSSLYVYGTQTIGGTYSSKQVFYTLEKPGNNYLFLKNILNNKFRNEVKEFYKDTPAVMQIIDTKLKYWLDLDKDLMEILRKANME
ncbi:hypothetical protein CLV59_108178 [Chitinophaga dinghuensis]|uniref:GLPGLI family protein n=1 Tax=Chitinophaga dinghuensis TaxID=1539050 RepID=A0A327VRS9_9BACT|nr:hypothetical protein [Chitinophaga dinghuensis]RAJ76658.1 hypothetical protein CLV59_108178 [Chitinophaga dinghuensis]